MHLPPDFQLSYKQLRGMAHEHVSLRQVQGELLWRFVFGVTYCCLLPC
jgi:hypothetical protein